MKRKKKYSKHTIKSTRLTIVRIFITGFLSVRQICYAYDINYNDLSNYFLDNRQA